MQPTSTNLPPGILGRRTTAAVVATVFAATSCANAYADRFAAAVRLSDGDAVERLLLSGKDVNARNDAGDTLLMQAVALSDADMVALLLRHGALVHERNSAGATALMWAVGSGEKTKLLLRSGADVNASTDDGLTPLIMAAVLPESLEVVRMLIERGADVNANANRFSPLMAASFRGDPETVELLIEAGADPTARNQFGYSPLHGASFNGSANITKLLLSHGVDPNVDVNGFTPAMWASVHGKKESLGMLLDAGADVNAQQNEFGTTPLLWAATTGRYETIEMLLAANADQSAEDAFGGRALDWAARRGDQRIIDLLGAAPQATPSTSRPTSDPPIRAAEPPSPDHVRISVEQSLRLLQKTGPAFSRNSDCASCHHQSLPAMAYGLARSLGYDLDEKTVEQQRSEVIGQLLSQREDLLQGFGAVDVLDPAFFLTGLAAEDVPANRGTDAAVAYLAGRQRRDGSWRNVQHRPPMQQSDVVNTALGIRALQAYGLPGRQMEMKERVARASRWLQSRNTDLPHEAAMALLGLHWAGANSEAIRKTSTHLASKQAGDGGWSQLPGLASDAFATGLALVALRESGVASTNDAIYQRGVSFLLQSQHDDGSWYVESRSFPVQPYFETSFPHGRSQFISTAATAWATMALLPCGELSD